MKKFILTGIRSIENVKVDLDRKRQLDSVNVLCPFCNVWKSLSIDKGRKKNRPVYNNFIRHVKNQHCVPNNVQIVNIEEIEMVSIQS